MSGIHSLPFSSCGQQEVTGGQTVAVRRFIKRPDYDGETIVNDIAILELDEDLRLGGHASPVLLPGRGEAGNVGEKVVENSPSDSGRAGNCAPAHFFGAQENFTSAVLHLYFPEYCHRSSAILYSSLSFYLKVTVTGWGGLYAQVKIITSLYTI